MSFYLVKKVDQRQEMPHWKGQGLGIWSHSEDGFCSEMIWAEPQLCPSITNSMDMNFGKVQEMGGGQGGLACCCPGGGKESDTAEQHSLTTTDSVSY